MTPPTRSFRERVARAIYEKYYRGQLGDWECDRPTELHTLEVADAVIAAICEAGWSPPGAVQAEREACAQIADARGWAGASAELRAIGYQEGVQDCADLIAASIRAGKP